ncbi:NAD-dependent epimerase/dehydratase family protein [Salirhabdus salicampi]|uniref:NAD-dependent epimerase/dehydratase family protein n=1 Tax=Salirhabdus salicampi TaxID=476102 RepID=UPI0020C3F8E7|nr:NAD(P)-dependent oxidoreductase [Salirhabdus salicampi]MCP8615654.1 NAD(P)-dependent oxidoreductase [Salirhabdus salicampi]
MRVLITGAGGNLGRVLAPALEKNGHEPVLLDYRDIETAYPFIRGDVRDSQVILEATKDIDAIVHGAALHGIHLENYSNDDFWDLNVTGTKNVYEAALKNNVKKVLLCSTMGVYGESIPNHENAYSLVTEELELMPADVYGLTKKLCEELGEFYYRKHNIQTIAFRLGMFVPETFVQYGLRLLVGGVDDRDVAHAFIQGLSNEEIGFDYFNIMSAVPFTVEDEKLLYSKPRDIIEKYYPGSKEIFTAKEVDVEGILRMWGTTYWSIQKAAEKLNFHPQYNFDGFLQALKEDDRDYYPFANLPWWGV